jgi:hypothetical protein
MMLLVWVTAGWRLGDGWVTAAAAGPHWGRMQLIIPTARSPGGYLQPRQDSAELGPQYLQP